MSTLLSRNARRALLDTGRCEIRLDSTAELLSVAESLGKPVAIRPRGPTLDTLTPIQRTSAPRNSLSSIYGTGAFPLHTDAAHHRSPPRWALLRCADPGRRDRPTLVVDAHELEFCAREVRAIGRVVWRVKTGIRSFLASALLPTTPVGCLYSIGDAGGGCPGHEEPLETDAGVQSTAHHQSRQRSTAGERKTAAFQSPIEFWHPTRPLNRDKL
jgi:hypothetical protein